MYTRLVLYWLVKITKVVKRRESHSLGVATSISGNRHGEKNAEGSSERTNCWKLKGNNMKARFQENVERIEKDIQDEWQDEWYQFSKEREMLEITILKK